VTGSRSAMSGTLENWPSWCTGFEERMVSEVCGPLATMGGASCPPPPDDSEDAGSRRGEEVNGGN